MGSEDQALTVHSKSTKIRSHHSRGKHSHKDNTRKYFSKIRCYTCDEVGHFARNQEIVLKDRIRKRETKEHIMLMLQRMMNHPRKELDYMKVKILQARMNMF